MPENPSTGLAKMLQEFDNSTSQVDSIKTKTRAFLLVQAKRELDRIIKLTEFLDKLEDTYQTRVLEYLNDDRNREASIFMMPQIIRTVSDCLARSEEIVKLIAKDDKLFSLVYIDNSTSNSYSNSSVLNANLDDNSVKQIMRDPASRKRVRDAIVAVQKELGVSQSEIPGELAENQEEEI